MAAPLSFVSANVETAGGTYEKVVLTARGTTITLRERGRTRARREDVATVVNHGNGTATITFADGTEWQATRLATGGCSSCAERRARRTRGG